MIILSLLFLLGLFLLWRIPLLKSPEHNLSEEMLPKISIIIPARNEAKRIKALLASIQSQEYPTYEVILVDDASEDETASIANEMGARVLSIDSLPEGWLGKNWACWQGARQSHGEVLLFLDADTWLERDALKKIATTLLNTEGMLTVQPYHITHKFYEQLSAFMNIVTMAGVNAFTLLGKRLKPSGGFGPCIACHRKDYFRVGGHSSIPTEVLEDVALAKRFLDADLSVNCFGGSGTIYFRMYPNGLRELIEGWAKGLALGAKSIHPVFLILCTAWVCGCFGVFVDLIKSFLNDNPSILWIALYSMYAWEIHWMLKRIGRFNWWTSFLYPIPLISFTLIMVYSLIRVVIKKQVKWKGRSISINSRG